MYQIKQVCEELLAEFSNPGYGNTIFTTYEWVQFLKKNQNAEPIVLELRETDDRVVGYFVGLIIKKFGIKIVGSPFEGWLTPDMGFIRLAPFDINEALRSVSKYTLNKLKCWFLQITDKNINKDDLESDIYFTLSRSLNIDISRDVEEIFGSFTKSTRKLIRQFEERGAIVREVPFDRHFAEIYYDQLTDVFAKQGLLPNYNLKKIADMADALKNHPERVLAMQIFSPDERCIASSIYLGFNHWCYSLGTASFRKDQHYRPNEMIRWHGINYWKNKGIFNFDLVGYREYKLKFAPEVVEQPTIIFAKYKILVFLKNLARTVVEKYRTMRK